MTAYTSHFVSANGITLHYYRSAPAAGRPPIVLLHGLTDNGMCWVQVADRLRDAYEIIMPDTRGHGRSDKPETGYNVEELAADVAALIDALALDRPVLMGHSMGGEVTTAVAGLYPEKVGGIILEDPAWFTKEAKPEESAAQIKEWSEGLLQNQSMSREALIEACRQQNPLWAEEDLAPWADAKREMNLHALQQILGSIRVNVWQELLQKARCPILLITAEPGRSIITPEMAQEAAGLWKQGRVAHIAGAGHSIHREQLEPLMDAIQAFLHEVLRSTKTA